MIKIKHRYILNIGIMSQNLTVNIFRESKILLNLMKIL